MRNPRYAAQSRSNALGQLDYGHTRLACARNRNADVRAAKAQAVRPNEPANIEDDEQKYSRPRNLSACCHVHAHIRWYVSVVQEDWRALELAQCRREILWHRLGPLGAAPFAAVGAFYYRFQLVRHDVSRQLTAA